MVRCRLVVGGGGETQELIRCKSPGGPVILAVLDFELEPANYVNEARVDSRQSLCPARLL